MRKFIKTLALTTAAVVCAVSCNKDYFDDTTNQKTEGTTLYANTPTNVNTKVGFEDKDSEGIAISWEDGDSFKLYNSNNELVDTFTTTGDGEFTSSEADTKLVKGEQYTAKYNEDADLLQQNGDDIRNLNAACQMEATFTYGDGKKIEFAHTMAIMTFTFKSDERPDILLFENGEEKYIVQYSTLEPNDNDIYTSHIMINPCEATQRTLTFTIGNYVYDFEPYDIRSVNSNKSYEAGKRYTAPISNITKWDELAAESFAKEGEISTAAELALLAKNVNDCITTYEGKTFTLTKDIDLSGHEWVAIGNLSNKFHGTFDGAGRTINGLYITESSKGNKGLFGNTSGATIKNLSVSSDMIGGDFAGGIVGDARCSTITNCYSNCSITTTINRAYVGGIVGYTYDCIITNCYNSGSIVCGINACVGGIVGFSSNSTITNCYNRGSVVGGYNALISGIVGYSENSTINNSYNSGSVIDDESTFIGGVIGKIYNTTTITNCYYLVNGSLQGIGGVDVSQDGTESKSIDDMLSEDFMNLLNDNKNTYNSTTPAVPACDWGWESGKYPYLVFEN